MSSTSPPGVAFSPPSSATMPGSGPALPSPSPKHATRNNGPIIAGLSFLYAVMICCALCRAYSKVWLVGRVWWDDAAFVIGTIGTTIAVASIFWQMTAGTTGYSMWDLTMSQIQADSNFIANLWYIWGGAISTLFLKASCVLMYWLFFSMIRWMRIVLLILGPLLVANHIVWTVLAAIYFTPPPGYSWTQQEFRQATQTRLASVSIYASIGTVVTNFVLVILPIVPVVRMQLPWRRRLGIILVLSAGLLACAASIADVWCRLKMTMGFGDLTRDFVVLDWISATEYMVTNCCVCAPAAAQTIAYLRPLAAVRRCLGLPVAVKDEDYDHLYSMRTLVGSTIPTPSVSRKGTWNLTGPSREASRARQGPDPKMQALVTTTIAYTTGSVSDTAKSSENGPPAEAAPAPLLFEGNKGIDACRGVITYISAPPRPRGRSLRRRG